MPRYPSSWLEELRARSDIVQVVSGYVPLKKSGRHHWGLCPFHGEKTASFSVDEERQLFYCFGCKASGDVISFLMEMDHLTFQEAVETLAERAHLPMPEMEDDPDYIRRRSQRERLLEANRQAAVYYHEMLFRTEGLPSLRYLKERGLDNAVIRKFGLGAAPDQWDALTKHLLAQGFTLEELSLAGLTVVKPAKNGESSPRAFDMFRNRAIFPIIDMNRNVLAFGGRSLGKQEPKYLNTAETKVFDKSRNMYGLNVARRSKKDYRIVCEGYMDVISMHQAGFTEAVASLGTAFTSGHASLLHRYTKEVRLIYDSDAAGVKAALRAIPLCRQAGLVPRIVDLSPHKDPDEFINALGEKEFQKRLDEAENAFFFSLRMAERDHDLKDPEGRTAFLEHAALMLSDIEDELKRENYISSVAAKYMINENTLKKAVVNEAVKKEGANSRISIYRQPEKRDDEARDNTVNAEKYLLTWLTDENTLFTEVSEYLGYDDFTEGVTRECAKILFEQMASGRCEPASIIDRFEDEETHKKVASIFSTKLHAIESGEEKSRALTDLVVKIKEASLKRQADVNDDTGGENLLQRRIRIRKAMDSLKSLKIEV